MKKYFVLCVLVSSLQAMEWEKLSYLNDLQKKDSEAKRKETREEKIQNLQAQARANITVTADDIDLISAYEKELKAKAEEEQRKEKKRPVIALERIAQELAQELALHNKINLIKLYITMVGAHDAVNELEDLLNYRNTQECDLTFSHFVEVVKNLGNLQLNSATTISTENKQEKAVQTQDS